MTELLSPPEAARLIGTNVAQVKEWMRRARRPAAERARRQVGEVPQGPRATRSRPGSLVKLGAPLPTSTRPRVASTLTTLP